MGCHLGQEQRHPAELREQRLEMLEDRIYMSSSGNEGKEGIGVAPQFQAGAQLFNDNTTFHQI